MKRTILAYLFLITMHNLVCTAQEKSTEILLLPGERVWSGVIKDGQKMPYMVGSKFDFYANNKENQIQPLLLGNKGLWVWSEEPFAFEVGDGKIIISKAKGEVFRLQAKYLTSCCSRNRNTIPGLN